MGRRPARISVEKPSHHRRGSEIALMVLARVALEVTPVFVIGADQTQRLSYPIDGTIHVVNMDPVVKRARQVPDQWQ